MKQQSGYADFSTATTRIFAPAPGRRPIHVSMLPDLLPET
jgi:hypothetical protein